MKILTVCSAWRVFGAETITLKMLEGFKQNGHEQQAVTSFWSDGDFNRRLESLGIADLRVAFGTLSKLFSWRPMWGTANSLVRLPWLWMRWAQVLRQFRPDVVIYTSSRQCLLLYPWLSRQPSFLMEFTGTETSNSNRRLYQLLSSKLSCFVAVSEFMQDHLHRIGAPAEKIRVIKSGTFFERDRRATEQTVANFVQNRSGPFRIGIAGQVASTKGHDSLVEAVRLLRDRGIKLVVQVFGSGDAHYVSKLKGKIAAANLTEVWNWMGYEQDKAKIFGRMDVCVVPSCFGDPFPTVAMEAGVYGLPVVASRIGGLPEIVQDGVTGWLVAPNSPAQLADKLEWLIKNPERAREMGRAGRERVLREFTVEKMVAEFEALFGEFAGKQKQTAEI